MRYRDTAVCPRSLLYVALFSWMHARLLCPPLLLSASGNSRDEHFLPLDQASSSAQSEKKEAPGHKSAPFAVKPPAHQKLNVA